MIDVSEYKNAEKVFYFFEEISKIPHGSENTEKIADYLVEFAKARGLWHVRDKANNVIIRKSATKGYENRPTVIFQGHTDMVADKVAGCPIDLEKEGLKLYRDGDFLRAEGTTLGGDDGVAVAYALAVLDSDDIEHPEFEALFTSDEEIGLIGATFLDASQLKGKLMVNIDSDDEGVFTVGCAGGIRTDARLEAKRDGAKKLSTLSVSGLKGGHSGVEIDKGRVNAIKLLAKILAPFDSIRVSKISGGNADNAIARECNADVYISPEEIEVLKARVIPDVLEEIRRVEPDVKIALTEAGVGPVFDEKTSKCILNFANSAPYGVIKMSEDIVGLPETSANLGIAESDEGGVSFTVSIRSSKNGEKEKVKNTMRTLCAEYGFEYSERGEYPAWEYKKDSYLREVMKRVYTEMYGKEPEVITIHAGLECGIFSDKIEGLDCVSIGPDNYDIHTPEERLSIPSTVRVWEYLITLLKNI